MSATSSWLAAGEFEFKPGEIIPIFFAQSDHGAF
jgi:hypothetical protein